MSTESALLSRLPDTALQGNESSGSSRNQYNPAAADWSMAPAAVSDVSDYIPQPSHLTQNVVSKSSSFSSFEHPSSSKDGQTRTQSSSNLRKYESYGFPRETLSGRLLDLHRTG